MCVNVNMEHDAIGKRIGFRHKVAGNVAGQGFIKMKYVIGVAELGVGADEYSSRQALVWLFFWISNKKYIWLGSSMHAKTVDIVTHLIKYICVEGVLGFFISNYQNS